MKSNAQTKVQSGMQGDMQSAEQNASHGEAFSCLIDGELDATHCGTLIERLCGDPQARRQWAQLNAACDALRSSEVARWHNEGFAARVGAALEAEPTVLAPQAQSKKRIIKRVVLPSVAMAAAAALLVVVVVPQMRGPAESAPQIAVSPSPATSAAVPVAATAAISAPNASAATVVVDEANVARSAELEAYFQAHREMAGTGMMPGPTLYMRASSNNSESSR